MNYVKKMCILRQIKQGFSGDGKTLSGLVKIEQYGKNLAVEVSIINFAPLSAGEYYCLLSDGKGRTEMLSLRGKSLFNILSDVDITGGFCAIICHVKNDVVPIAYGINGNGSYDWRTILNATLPPVFPNKKGTFNSERTDTQGQNADDFIAAAPTDFVKNTQNDGGRVATNENYAPISTATNTYDDEKIVNENYYQENEREQDFFAKNCENAHDKGTMEIEQKIGSAPAEDGNAEGLLHPFKKDPDGYYLSIKGELDELFNTYPRDESLNGAFSYSEWVRLKGTAKDPQYLVGVLYQDGRAKYVCYALKAEDKNNPPDEIKKVCTFVPCSLFQEEKGFFVLFQSTATGECIKPERA